MKTFLGLDIGGTKCAVLLAKVQGGIDILEKLTFETRSERGFESVFADLCQGIERLLKMTQAKPEAIGISCGGPLNSESGLVLSPPNLPGWDNIPLVKLLQDKYGIPAYLQNDANACALVEWKLGAGRGSKDMIFLTMGTGMGGGIITNGRLLIGRDNMGGEIGHLRLTEDGPLGFNKHGSFEGYTSGGGIRLQAIDLTRRLVQEGRPPQWVKDGYAQEDITAKLIADYAKNGDTDALEFYEFIGKMLGRGLSLLVDTLNPEKIVIGSIFARSESLLRPAMEKELEKEAIPYSLTHLQVLPAKTGERLGDYASIMTALYALDIDPLEEAKEEDKGVLEQYERLFTRYPALSGLRDSIMQAYLMLRTVVEKDGKILIAGNGGSASDAMHIVGELMKGFRLKRPLSAQQKAAVSPVTESLLPGTADRLQQGIMAICLNEHQALSSAVVNDLDPLLPFSQQVMGYGRKGDLFIAISTSGNAKNLAIAAQTAKAMGLRTLALTGRDGGLLKTICDQSVIAPGENTADIQEHHLPIYHTLCAMIEAKLFEE